MEPTANRITVDTGVSFHKHPTKTQALSISGCNSVYSLMGIGKLKPLAAMEKKRLIHLGNLSTTQEDIMTGAPEFHSLCYNITKEKICLKKDYGVYYFPMFSKSCAFTIILYEKTMCPKTLISFYKISFQVPPNSKFLFSFPGIKHGSSTCQKSCQQHQSCPCCHQRMKLLLRMF